MKKIFRTISLLTVSVASLFCFQACSLEENPATMRSAREYYSDYSECLVAVNGLYGALRDFYSASYFPMLEFPADYTRTPKTVDNANKNMVFYRWTAEHSMMLAVYAQAFKSINCCNNVIDNLNEAAFLKEDSRSKMVAEARFIRGLIYFNLVRCFGELPVVLSQTEDPKKTDFPKWTNEDILKKVVIADLECAEKYLDFDYNNHRASGVAAKALLAKAYLWMASCAENNVIYHKWVADQGLIDAYKGKCRTYCGEIMANPAYDLYADYYDLWLESNKLQCKGVKEYLFAVNYQYDNDNGNPYCQYWSAYGAGSAPGWDLTPGREPVCMGKGTNVMAPTKEFYEQIVGNTPDQRQTKMFVVYNGNTAARDEFLKKGGNTNPDVTAGNKGNLQTGQNFAPCKYRHGSGLETDGKGSAQIPVIRMADVLLMYAEACGFGDQTGLDALIRVRRRSYKADGEGNPYTTTFAAYASSKEYIRDIVSERRIELSFECDRWFDLVRHHMVKEVVESLRMTYNGYSAPVTFTIDNEDKRSFFPLPNAAILRNTALKQNGPWEGDTSGEVGGGNE